jgi:DNA-binding MarR family transcriptional regulator
MAESPQNDELSVGVLLNAVRKTMLINLDAEIEPYGLTGTQYAVLRYIEERIAETAADLCSNLYCDTSTMTRMLDHLEEKEFVRRERCNEDRRVVYLRATTSGRAVLPQLRAGYSRVLARLFAGFTADEMDTLRHYLSRMIESEDRAATWDD